MLFTPRVYSIEPQLMDIFWPINLLPEATKVSWWLITLQLGNWSRFLSYFVAELVDDEDFVCKNALTEG